MPSRRLSGKPVSKGPSSPTKPEVHKSTMEVDDPAAWDGINEMLAADNSRVATNEDRIKQEQINQSHLGYALFQFGGPKTIHGFIPDVNNPPRINPRPLNPNAVAALILSVAETGVRDRPNAIIAKVKKSEIPETILKQMAVANPTNLTSHIPVLDIKRRCPERELALETELMTEYRDGNLLSTEDLEATKAELSALRDERHADGTIVLVNGFHRLQMMLLRLAALEEKRCRILTEAREGNADADMQQDWLAFQEELRNSTYLVSLYDMDTPAELILDLAENEAVKPNNPPTEGEKIWMATKKQEAIIKRWQDTGIITSRIDGLNRLHDPRQNGRLSWDSALYGEAEVIDLIERIPGITKDATTPRIPKDRFKGLSATIMGNPTTMELACATRDALPVWSMRLKDMHAKIMVREKGACFIAHAWLSLDFMIRICSVQTPIHLDKVKDFIVDNEKKGLDPKGLPEARPHMENMLHTADNTSGQLIKYESTIHEEAQMWAYSNLTSEELRATETDFTSDFVIATSRRMREEVGKSLCAKANKAQDRQLGLIGLTLRVSARLPLWERGCDIFHFFPAELLPSRSRFQDYASTVPPGENSTGCLALELLLQSDQLAWTCGWQAASNSRNHANWYGRIYGLHRLLLWITGTEALGCITARLQLASDILEGATLRMGLVAAEQGLSQRVKDLKDQCGVAKSGNQMHPILVDFANRHNAKSTDAKELEFAFNEAAERLAHLAFTKPDIEAFNQELKTIPVFRLIEHNHWDRFNFWDWLHGWSDKKHLNSVKYGLAWAFFEQQLREVELPQLFDHHPNSRKLLKVVGDLLNHDFGDMWWNKYGFNTDDSEPVQASTPMAIDVHEQTAVAPSAFPAVLTTPPVSAALLAPSESTAFGEDLDVEASDELVPAADGCNSGSVSIAGSNRRPRSPSPIASRLRRRSADGLMASQRGKMARKSVPAKPLQFDGVHLISSTKTVKTTEADPRSKPQEKRSEGSPEKTKARASVGDQEIAPHTSSDMEVDEPAQGEHSGPISEPLVVHLRSGQLEWTVQPIGQPVGPLPKDFDAMCGRKVTELSQVAWNWNNGYTVNTCALPFAAPHTAYIEHLHVAMKQTLSWDEVDAYILKGMRLFPKVLSDLNGCRIRLRQSLWYLAKRYFCQEDPYAVQTMLIDTPAAVDRCLDLYMFDLAATLSPLGVNNSDGLLDAQWLMKTDRTSREKIITCQPADEGGFEVILDLTGTFPREMQTSVPRSQRVIVLPSAPVTAAMFERVALMMSRTFPLRTYAISKSHMRDRAGQCVAHELADRVGDTSLMFTPAKDELRKFKESIHGNSSERTTRLEQVYAETEMKNIHPHPMMYKRSTIFASVATDQHPFGTGQLDPDKSTDLQEEKDPTFVRAQEALTSAWETSKAELLGSHTTWLSGLITQGSNNPDEDLIVFLGDNNVHPPVALTSPLSSPPPAEG